MDLLFTLLTIVSVVVLRWIINKVTYVKSSLASLAGPKSDHWLKGVYCGGSTTLLIYQKLSVGNLGSIYQNGLEYNLVLQEKFGGIVKVHGMLGVSQHRSRHPMLFTQHASRQIQYTFPILGQLPKLLSNNRMSLKRQTCSSCAWSSWPSAPCS